jgi:hypothetical protein
MAVAGLTNFSSNASPDRPSPPKHPRKRQRPKWLVITGVAVLAGVMVGIWFAGQNWPFRYRKMKPMLEEVFGSQVAISHYHRVYFPDPGFIATGLTIRRKSAPNQPPLGTVQTMFVHSRWIDLLLLHKRIQLVEMTGVHLVLPPPGSEAAHQEFPSGSTGDFRGPETPIARLEIHASTLDILRQNGSRFTFPIHHLHIENLARDSQVTYAVNMDTPMPYGAISASGNFGPLNVKTVGETRVSGRFIYDHIRLHDAGKLYGTMRASGSFAGSLAGIHADADAQVPDFAVDDGKPTPLAGRIDCTVSGLTGDVHYHSLEVTAGNSTVRATGSTAGSGGKATTLDIAVDQGRVEDILHPFLHRPVPVKGPVRLHAHAYLAPSREGDFFHRLHVDGAFDVPKEVVTDRETERSLSAFSVRAQGGKAPDASKDKSAPLPTVLSSLTGPTTIRNAVVTTHGLTFKVAGAQASLSGTFNLHDSAVHLVGDVTTKADIAHDATGWKSILLKPLAPFFRKKKAGAVIPIAVTGVPGHYKVSQNITHAK